MRVIWSVAHKLWLTCCMTGTALSSCSFVGAKEAAEAKLALAGALVSADGADAAAEAADAAEDAAAAPEARPAPLRLRSAAVEDRERSRRVLNASERKPFRFPPPSTVKGVFSSGVISITSRLNS